jgi:transcriptional regulator GlxA family with amidase domain
MTINVGIFLFPEVEVLDFAGPYEVFTTAARVAPGLRSESPKAFSVFSIVETMAPVAARAGLKFVPDFTVAQHPAIDVLIIPGGVVNAEMEKLSVIEWIKHTAATTKITASVCTGAFLLAKSAVITSQKVTTHWEDIADLQQAFPSLDVLDNVRWVDEDTVVTSAGISAGIDMSLHLVSRIAGMPLAEATARQMEFEWTQKGG